jgi:PAS domain S-box-containing protein
MATDVPLILVVDDNDAARYVKSRVLRLAGFRVVEAATGLDGIARCKAEQPQLALLDVKLPDVHGLEVCRRLKADPATAGVLVLQTSAAMIDTAHRVRALDAGADSYLVEPIEPEELVANVRALLRLRRAEEASRSANSALQRSEARFRQFADSVSDAFWLFSPEQDGFVYISPAWERLFGQAAEQVMANKQHRFDKLHPDDRQRVQQRFEALAEDRVFEEEYRICTSGGERWISERAFPVVDERSGDITAYAGIAQDSTLRKQAELVLMHADRQKDEFLAMLAHELRSPLGPLRSAAEYLRRAGSLEGTGGRHALDIVSRQVDHLARLVDDLLEVSRINHGKINLRLAPVLLRNVVDSAVDAVRSLVDAKAHRLQVDLPDEPVWLFGDAVRLAQVFSNLLHNAAKFTSEGGDIVVRATADAQRVLVEVADNGVGIRRELLPRVFDLFTQDEASLDRSLGGLGIGLSLVRQLVELHQGQVRVDSAGPGQGTTFSLRFERHAAPVDASASEGPALAVENKRVLVVDDNLDAAEAMAMLLEAGGHTVACENDGRSALQRAASEPPDVVLLDIGLPVMNGYEVARNLRALPQLERVKLIAVSGYGSEADKRRALESGFDHHLTKPVDYDELLALITA